MLFNALEQKQWKTKKNERNFSSLAFSTDKIRSVKSKTLEDERKKAKSERTMTVERLTKYLLPLLKLKNKKNVYFCLPMKV